MITEQQLKDRQKYLGSSDVAALFTDENGHSLDPFKNAADVYVSKTQKLDEPKTSDAIERGIKLEPYLIEYASRELGCEIETQPDKINFVCKDHPIFAANLDGYTVSDTPSIVEAKTTGMCNEWGEPFTDQVPFRVLLQVHQQMLCSGFKDAYVVVLMGKWGLREEIYHIERNEEVVNAIIKRGEQFWNEHVIPRVPPEKTLPMDTTILKRVTREPSSYADVDESLVNAYIEAKDVAREAKRAKDHAFAELLYALGDAEGVKLSDGREFIYLEEPAGKVIDRNMLKVNYPDVYAKVATSSTRKMPRIRKPKGE